MTTPAEDEIFRLSTRIELLKQAVMAEERAKSEGLRTALERFGMHAESCDGCTCGLDAALSSSPSPTPKVPVDTGDPAIDVTKPIDEPAACPFCASDDVVNWLSHDAAPNVWTVFCQTCGAEGPHSTDENQAIELWSRRPGVDAPKEVPPNAAIGAPSPTGREEAVREVVEACERLGYWMSAAIESGGVCDEMKADIRTWFDALSRLDTSPSDT